VPQVLPNFVSYTLLRTEINVRASTIIGAVGGGGIGEAAPFDLAEPRRQDGMRSSLCCS
jgi:ABC-type phosphate/phosphonate transport system permease subunit